MTDDEARKLLKEVRDREEEWRDPVNGGGGEYHTWYGYFTVEHILRMAEALEERLPKVPWTEPDEGYVLECSECPAKVTLGYVDADHVSLEGADGWTGPPPRCPECSAKIGRTV